MTEKLYYKDSHLKAFKARVLSCVRDGERYKTVLDRTAFFPEGGGQAGDSGYIGEACVSDTHEKDGEVIHYVNQALEVGAEYECRIDWETRFRRMQNHSGEHIVSGLVHKKYGYSNVGFHMGASFVTIDFDGEISSEQLAEIEHEANLAVAADQTVKTSFPTADELGVMEYRSKLELTENVRIVQIGDIDICACCAPHVNTTSEIGIIKILGSERRRRGGEGVRITMLCGLDAYDNYVQVFNNNTEISRMLSAKREETAAAVSRLLNEQEKLKNKTARLSMQLAKLKADMLGETDGNICIFDDVLDEPALRELINEAVKKCGGIAAVFSGSDETGYKYIMGSRTIDLRKHASEINAAINGRGGGKPEMIQGNCTSCSLTILNYLSNYAV